MAEHLEPGTRSLDDQLADYADQLLDGEMPDELKMSTQDQELRGYLETLVLMKRVVENNRSGEDRFERVRLHLVKVWQESGIQESYPAWQKLINQVWQKLHTRSRPPAWQSTGKKQRTYALRFAVVVVIVLLATFFIFPTLNVALPGTAGSQADLVLFVLIFMTLLGFIVWWFINRKG